MWFHVFKWALSFSLRQLWGTDLIYILFFVTFQKCMRQLDKNTAMCHLGLMAPSNKEKAFDIQLTSQVFRVLQVRTNSENSGMKVPKTPIARQTCEIINSSHWRVNVCSITSFFEKILSAQFEVCPLQMRKQNYCASKAENRTRFARIRWLCILQIRFDVHQSFYEKLYLWCSHYRARVRFIP